MAASCSSSVGMMHVTMGPEGGLRRWGSGVEKVGEGGLGMIHVTMGPEGGLRRWGGGERRG